MIIFYTITLKNFELFLQKIIKAFVNAMKISYNYIENYYYYLFNI